jgi:hypothetical protein
MPKKSTSPQGEWSRGLSDEVRRPKKPEHLCEVLKHLEPFSEEPHGEFDGKRYWFSREHAVACVDEAAGDFNTARHGTSPRFWDVMKEFKSIQTLTKALADKLESLDDTTRHALQCATYDANRNDAAIRNALPKPSNWSEGLFNELENVIAWVDRLKGLANFMDETRVSLLDQRRKENRKMHDDGGNTSLLKRYVRKSKARSCARRHSDLRGF